MKKNIISLLLCVISLSVQAQTENIDSSMFNYKDGKIYYDTVVELKGFTKNQIYVAAKSYYEHLMKASMGTQLLSDDSKTGMLSFTKQFLSLLEVPKYKQQSRTYTGTTTILMKDGKIKITLSEFNVDPELVGMKMNLPANLRQIKLEAYVAHVVDFGEVFWKGNDLQEYKKISVNDFYKISKQVNDYMQSSISFIKNKLSDSF